MDLRAGDRMLFYTTTGWMMWNFLVSSLLLRVQPVLYDGLRAIPGRTCCGGSSRTAR